MINMNINLREIELKSEPLDIPRNGWPLEIDGETSHYENRYASGLRRMCRRRETCTRSSVGLSGLI